MAELECKLAERELSCFLPRRIRNWSRSKAFPEIHIHLHVLFFQLHEHPSSHSLAATLKEIDTCLPISTCALPFPVVFPRVSGFPAFFSHDHPSTSESASLFQAVPSHASTLPSSSSRVIDHPPTFTSSSAFPVGFSRLHFAFFSCSR